MAKVTEKKESDKGKRRRGYHEGSITERVDAKGKTRYQAQVLVDGKRYTKTFATKPEANRWIGKTQSDAAEGMLPADGGKITVEAFLDKWLEASRMSIKPKAAEHYDWVIRLHVKPDLGKLKLAKLRADHLQTLYAKKLTAGLSPRSVHHFHRVIHKALNDAVQWGLVPRNVSDAAKAPSPQEKEMTAWAPEQAKTFLMATANDRLSAAYTVLLYCGLRLGELLGLRWSDIDMDAKRLKVQRTLQRLKNGKGLVVGEPKSAKGRRLIILSTPVVEALRHWKLRQIQERWIASERWQDLDYVFTTSVGTPVEPSNFNHYFRKRAKELELPVIRVHDLRHTCATLLMSHDVHPKVVQEMLGHSTISLTLNVYSHVTRTMQEDAARTMERILGAV